MKPYFKSLGLAFAIAGYVVAMRLMRIWPKPTITVMTPLNVELDGAKLDEIANKIARRMRMREYL